MRQAAPGRRFANRLVAICIIVSMVTIGLSSLPTAAQGTATIEITNVDADTGAPAPFTRFTVTSENGTVYGPLETDLNGFVAFSVVVDPAGTSFTVEEDTPPACATPPDPRTTEPLLAGESVSLDFVTQDNPGCGLGTIALYAMACPEGFAASPDDYAPWRDGCTGTNDGTAFTLVSEATGEVWNPVAGAYGIPGRAPVVGLPAGTYRFEQNGSTPAAAFCLVYDTANYVTSPTPSSVIAVPLQDGSGTIELTGNRISCDLFTAPGGTVQPLEPVAASTATLDVHLVACPPGYPTDGALYDDCHANGIDGVPVRVVHADGSSSAVATTLPVSPGPGVATFTALPAGVTTVSADVPAGSTVVVYCSDASDTPVDALFEDGSGSFTVDLVAGSVVTCDWYDIAPAVEPAVETSSLEFHALRCPAGMDPGSDLYGFCHESGLSGVTFDLVGPAESTASQTTTVPVSPGPGVAVFPDLSAGTYTASWRGFDPNATLVVYCSLADADDAVPFTTVGADSIVLDLPAGTGVVCDWYDIPQADASTTLQVTKYRCPVGMQANEATTLGEFQQMCVPTMDGIDFTLAPLGQQGSVLTTGTAGPGTVLFQGLPNGIYSLTEEIPGDFNTPWAFCGVEGGVLEPYTWIRGGQPLALDATAGPAICLWFNIPADVGAPSSVTVTSYLCPPGTTGDYDARCGSAPLPETILVLEQRGIFDGEVTTGVDGVATFDELGSGPFTLTAFPPSGVNVAVYVVSCTANQTAFAFDYDDRTGMRIRFELPSGTDVSCRWYNVPPAVPSVTPSDGGGSITVYKFVCLGKSVTAYNWETDCVVESAPVGFSLKTAAGRPIAVGTTAANGQLTFTNLANGAYRLDETTGDWCHAEADRVDAAGNVLVVNGADTGVYIYNCSLKQVGELPSTGTGPQASLRRERMDSETLLPLVLGAIGTLVVAMGVRSRLQQAAVRAGNIEAEPGSNRTGEDSDRTIS